MRVADRIIMDALVRGGCIKTFYRMCAKKAAQSELRIPDGYVLESPGDGKISCSLMLIFTRWRNCWS